VGFDRMAAAEAKIENLEGWQSDQNGSIHEVRQDVSKMKYWIMSATLGVALYLAGVIFMLLRVVSETVKNYQGINNSYTT
jgi:hypothetical protein